MMLRTAVVDKLVCWDSEGREIYTKGFCEVIYKVAEVTDECPITIATRQRSLLLPVRIGLPVHLKTLKQISIREGDKIAKFHNVKYGQDNGQEIICWYDLSHDADNVKYSWGSMNTLSSQGTVDLITFHDPEVPRR